MEEIAVRRAATGDAEACAYCHLLSWREAYAGIVDPVMLAERTADVEGRVARWRQFIEDGAERWIAVNPSPDAPVTDRVVGFSAPGFCRDEDAPRKLELYAIYVRQAWWGSGIGDRLLEVAIGNEPATLWVLEANARAQRFYARHGFEPDGARKDDPFFSRPEIRMVR
jgi:GNAT superfamily N-acetyltransferase